MIVKRYCIQMELFHRKTARASSKYIKIKIDSDFSLDKYLLFTHFRFQSLSLCRKNLRLKFSFGDFFSFFKIFCYKMPFESSCPAIINHPYRWLMVNEMKIYSLIHTQTNFAAQILFLLKCLDNFGRSSTYHL